MLHHEPSCTWRGFVLGICYCAHPACAGSDTPPLGEQGKTAVYDIHVRGMRSSPGNVVAGSTVNTPPDADDEDDAPASGDAGPGPGNTDPPPSADAGTMGGGGSVCDGFAVLKMSCGNGSFCHGSGSMVSAFADTAAGAAAFVGEKAEGSSCSSNSALIFNPDDPGASLVLTKLAATAPCGVGMPYGAAGSMSPADVTCIEEWIESL